MGVFLACAGTPVDNSHPETSSSGLFKEWSGHQRHENASSRELWLRGALLQSSKNQVIAGALLTSAGPKSALNCLPNSGVPAAQCDQAQRRQHGQAQRLRPRGSRPSPVPPAAGCGDGGQQGGAGGERWGRCFHLTTPSSAAFPVLRPVPMNVLEKPARFCSPCLFLTQLENREE